MTIRIKCHGEFYAKEGQLKLTKQFTETVRAPSLKFFEQTFEKLTGTDDSGALTFKSSTAINIRGQLKKKLLPMILAKKYPGVYVRVRGVVVDSVESEEGEHLDLPLNLMSVELLAQRIKVRNIPIDPYSYLSVDELRTDVMEYEQDPVNFQRTFKRKQERRAQEREFGELNDLIPAATPVVGKKAAKGIAAMQTPVADKNPF